MPGQSIPMTVEIDNVSTTPISGVVCELIQVGIIFLIRTFMYLFTLIISLFVYVVDSSLFLVV